jgi:hypothetical protein
MNRQIHGAFYLHSLYSAMCPNVVGYLPHFLLQIPPRMTLLHLDKSFRLTLI